MRSLRRQLLLGTALGMAVVLVLAGVVLNAVLGRTLRAEFDGALAARARALAAWVEVDEEGLDLEFTEAQLPEYEPSPLAEYYQLWLPDGTVLARSPSLGHADLPRTAGSLQTPGMRPLTLPDDRPGRLAGMSFRPRRETAATGNATETTIILAVARSTVQLDSALALVRRRLIQVGLCTVLLAVVVLSGVVQFHLRPIARLSAQISRVGEHDLSHRIEGNGIVQELRPVVDRLNDLLTRLEAAFGRERRFTGDVAHELRTPLAGIRAKLELALSQPRRPEEYRNAISDCVDISVQMQHLVENLLYLARSDAGQVQVCCEPVDVGAVARSCWQKLEARAAPRALRTDWNLAPAGHAMADHDLLVLVVHNLLDNAITYASPPGQVTIELTRERETVVFSVANSTRLTAKDAERVFERFWRADPSRARRAEAGFGLGLALCKALVTQLGGTITAAARGGVFEIVVRLAAAGGDRSILSS